MKNKLRQIIREEIYRILSEGGNAFSEVNSVVPKEHLDSVIKNAFKLAGLGNLKFSVVGNKNKKYLGDIDVGVESKDVADIIKYDGHDNKEFFKEIGKFLDKQKIKDHKESSGFKQFNLLAPLIDKTGKQIDAISDRNGTVNKGTPGWVQIDVFVGNLDWMDKALSAPTNSEYKAVYRNIFLAEILSKVIFKTKDPDIKRKFQIDWKNGVELVDFKVDNKGKKTKLNKKLVMKDADKLMKFLFGSSASFKKAESFEDLYKLFKSNKFNFPKYRRDIIDGFRKTIIRMKLDIPSEIR